MALEGTLNDFSLSDILQLIALQRKTGTLTLRSPDDSVTLGFDEGRLISAESSAKRMDTRLGTLLVKTGSLTPELLSKALELQGQTLQRLGFILLRNGFCTTDDLRSGLDIQIRKITFGLFRWTDGDYVFDSQDRVDYDREFVTPVSVESLLMEGARMMDEWPIIEKVVRSPQMIFQRVPVSQQVVQAEGGEEQEEIGDISLMKRGRNGSDEPIRISRAEWEVYQLVDGHRMVEAIIDRTFLSDFDGCKAFFDLLSRGLIAETRAVLVKGTALDHVTGELQRIQKKSPLSAGTVVVAAAVAALIFTGWSAQGLNPANLFGFPSHRPAVFESFTKSLSLLRLRLLSEAIDAYSLRTGAFPDILETVEASRLIDRSSINDPWGRRYRYVHQKDLGKYYLIGFDAEGRTDPDLFLSHVAQAPTREPSATRARNKSEIVVVN